MASMSEMGSYQLCWPPATARRFVSVLGPLAVSLHIHVYIHIYTICIYIYIYISVHVQTPGFLCRGWSLATFFDSRINGLSERLECRVGPQGHQPSCGLA